MTTEQIEKAKAQGSLRRAELTNLYHEYESEFGYDQAQLSLFASEVIPVEEIMQGIREELADEYLKHPAKEHLHQYLRYKLESDLDL